MKKFNTFTCYSMQAQKQNILYKVTEKHVFNTQIIPLTYFWKLLECSNVVSNKNEITALCFHTWNEKMY